MNVTVMIHVVMGPVLTYKALTLVPALLATSLTWMNSSALV